MENNDNTDNDKIDLGMSSNSKLITWNIFHRTVSTMNIKNAVTFFQDIDRIMLNSYLFLTGNPT